MAEREMLKPHHVEIRREKTTSNSYHATFCFKAYVIISMTIIWTIYTLLIKWTKSHDLTIYYPTTVVLSAEIIKCLLTLLAFLVENQFSFTEWKRKLAVEYFGKIKDLFKMSVPSLTYAIQNNLDFVALANLSPGIYQVTTQLKVVTTAVFMVLILGKTLSWKKWLAILCLFAGVALVQLDAITQTQNGVKYNEENYFVGLTAVLITCLTAGFAGVYFEAMLKDSSSTTPFWIRNLQLYSTGVLMASISCLTTQGTQIIKNGFFYGYNSKVAAIIGLLSLGGIYISLVMKYLDNLHKSFAQAIVILLVFIFSWLLFDSHLGSMFFVGSAIVVCALFGYNTAMV